ncbi:tetratricopeptide repeat protein [Arenimonas sp. MALMAid1274]|uniref:tetratricopeptide repeat protein n=1 Tax=Arenimonas sp. MALMAid1274 TaxID=3411630 RepID=UPI003BA251B1
MLANITEALRQGDLAAALAAARATVAEQPDNAVAHHLHGVCLQRSGDLAGARAAFGQALGLAPDQAAFHFSLASLDLAEGRVDAGLQGLKQSLALDPNQLGAYVTLVHLALGRNDLAEAERNLRLAKRVNGEHPQVLVAEGYLAQAQGDGERAMRCFTAASAADPTLAAAQLALGMAFLNRKMWSFAEQALSNSLALDTSRAPNTLRALAEARRRQGKAEQTVTVLDELIAKLPGDLPARGLRAEILAGTGREDDALPDFLAVLEHRPDHVAALRSASALLHRQGRTDEARAIIERALELSPGNDLLWMVRLNLVGQLQEDAKELLDRWLDRNPDSVGALELLTDYHRTRGDTALAEFYAERGLALDPGLQISTVVMIQAELAKDPALALERVDRHLMGLTDPERRRAMQGWAGVALDALGRHAEAAARWREMLQDVITGALPPPTPQGAERAPAGEIPGTLLWSPVGVRAEFVLRTAKEALGPRLRLDRIGAQNSGDGFGLLRYAPGHPEAGTAERWTQALVANGLDPANTVDWLPHLDGYTLAALGGAQVLALVTDPRDAFLNWIIHGSLQNYLVSPVLTDAADWLAHGFEALADHRDAHPDRVALARLDLEPAEAATVIENTLGLPEPLPAVFGTGMRFPTGHWRQYADAFGAEFARLAPVAVRLGYPLS